jgi:hypothetical protein
MDFLTRRNALLAGAGCLAMGVVGCATSGTTTTTVTADLTQAASVVTALNAAITTFETEAGSAITPAQLTTIQTAQGYIATINSLLTAAAAVPTSTLDTASISNYLTLAMNLVATLAPLLATPVPSKMKMFPSVASGAKAAVNGWLVAHGQPALH